MPNNHKPAAADTWRKLAQAISYTYGQAFSRSVEYLDKLVKNAFWSDAELKELPWHRENPRAQPLLEPQYVLLECVLNALAPSVPLRAIFSRNQA